MYATPTGVSRYAVVGTESHIEAPDYIVQVIALVLGIDAGTLFFVVLIEMRLYTDHVIAVVYVECLHPAMVGAYDVYCGVAEGDAAHYGGDEHVAGARHTEARAVGKFFEPSETFHADSVESLHLDEGVGRYGNRQAPAHGAGHKESHGPVDRGKCVVESAQVIGGGIAEEEGVCKDVVLGPKCDELRRDGGEVDSHKVGAAEGLEVVFECLSEGRAVTHHYKRPLPWLLTQAHGTALKSYFSEAFQCPA